MNKLSLASAMSVLLFGVVANAQEPTLDESATACRAAAELIDEGDIVGALDEAQWCVESLQQLKQRQMLALFPDNIEGYIGGPVENQSAMGMTMIERDYRLDGQSINVTLTTGAATGGFAALAQLGLGLGSASGAGTKLRVQKRTVVNMSTPDDASEYMVQLKSTGMLMFSSQTLDETELLDFLKAFPIAEVDDALEQ